jgi:hypothetical protein
MNDLDKLQAAGRLEQLGITVRSAELAETAKKMRDFNETGNRALRRAKARAERRRR